MKIALHTIISLLLLSGCTATLPMDDGIDDNTVEEGPVSIAYLKTLCGYRSTPVYKDISIVGTVMANDIYGEFYKTIVLYDGSAGIEIYIDKLRLCDDFPLYSRVAVFCNGLSLGRVGGKIVLGASPTDEYSVDRISGNDMNRYLHLISDTDHVNAPEIPTLKICELSVEHISMPVRIRELQFAEADGYTRWCNTVDGEFVDTDRIATDPDGNTIPVRFSGCCKYVNGVIPSGKVSIVGITDYTESGGGYALRLANHEIYAY